jgi:hypothetical protein
MPNKMAATNRMINGVAEGARTDESIGVVRTII